MPTGWRSSVRGLTPTSTAQAEEPEYSACRPAKPSAYDPVAVYLSQVLGILLLPARRTHALQCHFAFEIVGSQKKR
jgi:hypothetical protein